jgi:DNA-binding CsgD family transcriptional regulator
VARPRDQYGIRQRAHRAAIAGAVAITPRTVNKHLEHVYRKLEVTDRRQAVAAAFA